MTRNPSGFRVSRWKDTTHPSEREPHHEAHPHPPYPPRLRCGRGRHRRPACKRAGSAIDPRRDSTGPGRPRRSPFLPRSREWLGRRDVPGLPDRLLRRSTLRSVRIRATRGLPHSAVGAHSRVHGLDEERRRRRPARGRVGSGVPRISEPHRGLLRQGRPRRHPCHRRGQPVPPPDRRVDGHHRHRLRHQCRRRSGDYAFVATPNVLQFGAALTVH